MQLEFIVYAVPVAQPRQRHRIIQAKGKLFTTNYTPAKDPVNSFKFIVKETSRQALAGAPPYSGPLGMDLDIFLPRPKRLDTKNAPPGPQWHYGKKDVDNLFKSVADALMGVAYNDDGQICHATIKKYYHERSGRPRVSVRIWELT